ncbi:hypothetical protein B296_00057486 [Ensete ventricosum]|uniref:Uncharacterized protein n=1 Tax=Ensete ventricosum TaxID=4639 RepID=A0A426XQU1_ENSVE|nr:hypothetical protein B296_00057486 [Ensete ventricosum]
MRPRCSSNLVAIALCHGHRRPTLARCHDAVGNMIFPPPPNESLSLPWSRLRHVCVERPDTLAEVHKHKASANLVGKRMRYLPSPPPLSLSPFCLLPPSHSLASPRSHSLSVLYNSPLFCYRLQEKAETEAREDIAGLIISTWSVSFLSGAEEPARRPYSHV